MAYWLLKSEPDSFSWDQQVERGVEPWTGVRNHVAKRNLQSMRLGDLALFCHSNVGKEVVGIVEVIREAYPDPTAKTGDWACVDVRAVGPVTRPVTLAAMRADPLLSGMAVVRQSRLSVCLVTPAEWARVIELAGWQGRA